MPKPGTLSLLGFCEGAPEVRSTEQNSPGAARDKRDREHVYEIFGLAHDNLRFELKQGAAYTRNP
ncbi:hypothetical protein, partial [Endozoicomonas sp. ONNA2]|uniref:hypothetical protein n=1 Tax=Endozoicomonas sp. ONNA2 TaxID=2828741 RepID=UPI002147FAFA